ncbi:uncharacterized protein LOC125946997 [Dermacentor silvarum]|uniref:uncharacterized protein LOC125946997 n=1 Tax=Dermacentor silvarum TaxID=543639 RepID=UPI002100F98B|nr:uncharacterized protein LOC125946997 [Dermacentor silvarum]
MGLYFGEILMFFLSEFVFIEVARATGERLGAQVIAEYIMPCSVDAGTGLPQEMVPEPAHDAGIDADAAHFHPDYSNEQDLTASGGNDDAPLAGGPISGECSASNGIDNAPLPADPIRGDCSSSTGIAAPLAGGPIGENFSASMERQPAAAVFTPWVNSASQPPAGLFEVTNGQVKVGEGMFMPFDKWTFIMKNVSDGKCCLELAKHFWAPTEAATRSLTGQACRSMATEVKKLPATPEKVEMVKSKYIPQQTFHLHTITHIASH